MKVIQRKHLYSNNSDVSCIKTAMHVLVTMT